MKELLVKLAGEASLDVGGEDEAILIKCIDYLRIQINMMKNTLSDSDAVREMNVVMENAMGILLGHSKAESFIRWINTEGTGIDSVSYLKINTQVEGKNDEQ